jgi:hypothetical protein
MIRSVHIPHRVSRMGQSTSTITYFGSTCDQTDPTTGLCVSNVALDDPTNPLPGDPGAGQALSDYVATQTAQQNSLILNSGLPSTVAQAAQTATGLGLPGIIPSPFTFPSWAKWALLAGIGLVIYEGSR